MPSSWIPLILGPTVLTISTLWLVKVAVSTFSNSIQCKQDPTGRHNSLAWHPGDQRLSPKKLRMKSGHIYNRGNFFIKTLIMTKMQYLFMYFVFDFPLLCSNFQVFHTFFCWVVTFKFSFRSLTIQYTVVFTPLDLRYCYVTLLSPFFFIFVCISSHLLFSHPRSSDFLSGMTQAVWWWSALQSLD